MPISKDQLANIIGKSAALCRPEFDNAKSVSRVNEGLGDPDPSMYDGDAARWDAMFSDSAEEDYTPRSRDINYSDAGVARSQMPDNIKKSMMENKIDVSSLGQTSVIDQLGIKAKPMTAPAQKKKINEQTMTQPMQYGNVGGVDYSVIKAIVSECIREYFERQPINENTLKSILLQKGTISVVDSKGNVFKANLQKVGNANEKNGE